MKAKEDIENTFSKLVILANRGATGKLPILAQSLGIETEVLKDESLYAGELYANCLVALPYRGSRLDKYCVPQRLSQLMQQTPLFLYQVDEHLVDAEQAINLGIRGIILNDWPVDQIVRAIKALMHKQLYFDRALLSNIIDEMLQKQRPTSLESNEMETMLLLTRQEKKIIELVGCGARNKEIASNLNISSHTVKTHLSSIFRKTQSRNRVELLRWAQNIDSKNAGLY